MSLFGAYDWTLSSSSGKFIYVINKSFYIEESSKDNMAVSLCSINEDLNKDIRSFRFNRSTKARAMILKIDQNTKELKGM